VLPAILALVFADAQYLMIVRVIRMIRIFRVLKLRQYLTQAKFLLVALRGSKQKIIVFLVSVSPLVTVYGALMYVIEGPANDFTSIPTSIYWAVVILTTVGFGDIPPADAGRADARHPGDDHRLFDHRRAHRHLHRRAGQCHAPGRPVRTRLSALPQNAPRAQCGVLQPLRQRIVRPQARRGSLTEREQRRPQAPFTLQRLW
jgi:hypothetical protein